jgi:hypothetical protein
MPDGPRYDDDFYAWTQYQAEVLRTMRRADNRLDREHLAEEIDDLGKSERNAVRSQIVRIIEHLLKLEYSPAIEPRSDWEASVIEARQALADSITATLRREAEAMLPMLYARARQLAGVRLRKFGENEAVARLPGECPYTLDHICSDAWYPEPRRKPRPDA